MSVRARLVGAILLALLLSFGAGAGLAAWQAARSVRTELAAALVTGQESVAASLGDAPPTRATFERIVHSFDGSRHLRAELLNAGKMVLASEPARGDMPPRWFLSLASPDLAPILVNADSGALRLSADPANEAFERWTGVRDEVLVLALFSLVAAFLCGVSVTQGLRPLNGLTSGLQRLRRGAADVQLAETGPPEIAALATAFNQLSAALRIAQAQNIRLQTQILTLAEEERAEIARDLHDEVGPHLFAITTFAATLARQMTGPDTIGASTQLQAIQDSTASVQRVVRDLLGRLHEGAAQPASLADSLGALVDFWRGVHPDIQFDCRCDLDESLLTEQMHTVFFRVAQESLSNAVRHGRPQHVTLRLATQDGRPCLQIADNGLGGAEGPGFGLAGMRKRVASLGGSFEITRAPGWTVTAILPAPSFAPMPMRAGTP